MDELIKVGELMSNVFYNWSQDDKRFTDQELAMMEGLQEAWDNARMNLLKPPSPSDLTDWSGEGVA